MIPHHRASHIKPVPLLGQFQGSRREDLVSDVLVIIIERFDRAEVSVNDYIKKTVEQEAHAVPCEVRGTIPSFKNTISVEIVVFPNRNQPAIAHERIDLGLDELRLLQIDLALPDMTGIDDRHDD